MRRNNRLFSLVVVTVFMLACVIPSLAPTPAPLPTFDPNSLFTAIVETANAAATQTALKLPPTLTPTLTPIPTKTPTITPSPTATFYFVVATITVPPTQIPLGVSELAYDCQILSQIPANNTVFAQSSVFEARGLVANIGTGVGITVNHIYETLSRFTGNEIEPLHGPPRPGDVRNFWLDYSAAKEALGWEPAVPFEEGVRVTVASYR